MRAFALLALLALPATAQEARGPALVYKFDGSFEDAAFGIENAILNRGLNVEYTSHVGEMLERTREDVGSDVHLFDQANVYLFCSAVISRRMMEADIANIAHCPYGVFAWERDGEVVIGYNRYPEGAMQEVQSLLDEITQEAVSGGF